MIIPSIVIRRCLASLSACLAITGAGLLADETSEIPLAHDRTLGFGLTPIGDAMATETDVSTIRRLLAQCTGEKQDQGLFALEAYVRDNPQSPYAAALRSGLAKRFKDSGRYTRALEHWTAVWNELKHSDAPGAGPVVDFTLAHWTHLLATLGRTDELEQVFNQTGRRTLSDLDLQKLFNRSYDALGVMKRKPGIAYTCGTAALLNVARVMPEVTQSPWSLAEIPSPEGGFRMSQLNEYAAERGIPVVAVHRITGQEIVVPSVVHWKQNHYAAILEKNGEYYRVVDPTFGKEKWIKADAINEETSGHFMIPKDKVDDHWAILNAVEAQSVYGKGFSDDPPPPSTPPCPETPSDCSCNEETQNGNDANGNEGEGQDGPGGGGPSGCPGCSSSNGSMTESEYRQLIRNKGMAQKSGMPTWRVNEPHIELWLEDTPMFYPVPVSGTFSLDITYHQNDTRPFDVTIFNLGPGWGFNWLSYLNATLSGSTFDATLYGKGGGERKYSQANETTPERSAHTRLVRLYNGGNVVGFDMLYPGGEIARYGYMTNGPSGSQNAFITEMILANGRTNSSYRYTTTSGITKLTHVVDEVGGTNYLGYDGTVTSRIRYLTNAFGAKVEFKYGTTGGNTNVILTNIVDVVGVSSGFIYAWTNNLPAMTKMTTPYGDTTFEYLYQNPYSSFEDAGDADAVNRAIIVTEPGGGKHLYMYRDDSVSLFYAGPPQSFIPYSYPDVPSGVPVGAPTDSPVSIGLDNWNTCFRNSFYWGPRHFSALSTTNIGMLTTNDYRISRLKHWLHSDLSASVSSVLAIERDPAPTTGSEGPKTWYGHLNKAHVGRQPPDSTEPNWIVQTQPDGSTRYTYLEYNSLGNVTKEVETYTKTDGTIGTRTNQYVYATGNVDLIREIGPKGLTNWVYTYDSNHQMLSGTDLAGQVTTYTYNNSKQLTSMKSPTGLIVSNVYNGSGYLSQRFELEVVSSTNRFHTTNEFTYQNGNIKTQKDPRGLSITNTWDALNRLTSIYYPDGTYTSNRYDSVARPLDLASSRDRLGYWTYFTYNADRQLTAVTNALGYWSTYSYCTCGALDATTDAEGNTTQYFYDLAGRRLATVLPGGSGLTNRYNFIGQVTNTVHGAGVSVTNWYNHQGRLVAVSNAFGQSLRLVFDIEGNLISKTDADGSTTTMGYDLVGRVIANTNALGGIVRYGHSARGITAVTNQLSRVTVFDRDVFGRQVGETNANGEVVRYTYSGVGDLIGLTDGRAKNTSWGYDVYGRVTSKTNHNGIRVLAYQYDSEDQLTNVWSKQKGTNVLRYDAAGNLTNVVYPVSPSISFAYDKNNRPKTMVDGVGTTSYQYSVFGALLSEDGPWSDDTVSYGYDNGLRRQRVSIGRLGGIVWSQTYAYDSSGRLDGITAPEGTYDYQYTSSRPMRVQKLVLPSGASITNAYDGLARLTSTHLRTSGNALLNAHDYSYNEGYQRTRQTRTAGDYIDYTYDEIGQLKTAVGKESGGSSRIHEQFGYSYDAGGNLARRTNNALIQSFSVDDLNQLTSGSRSGTLTVSGTTASAASSVTVNSSAATLYGDRSFARAGFTPSNGNNTYTAIGTDSSGRGDTNAITVYLPSSPSFSYDDNGNLTSDGQRTFSYDDENQLISVSVSGSWKSEFAYDGRMRRRIRREYTWSGSAWQLRQEVRYVYDGLLPIEERNGVGVPEVTYTRGSDLSGSLQGAGGIGGLLGRTEGANIASYHTDGDGNVTALVNGVQAVVARYAYDPFGRLLASSGSLAASNLYRFSSKEHHSQSELVYYLYRYYQPNLQRWINEDPLGENGGINLFSYGNNAAINGFDPDGREWRINDEQDELSADDIDGDLTKGLGGGWVQKKKKKKKRNLDDCLDDCDRQIPKCEVEQRNSCYCDCWNAYPPTPRKKTKRQLIDEWSELNPGEQWPKTAHPHHIVPLADGGIDHGENIRPMAPKDHVQHHSEDRKRWGKRKGRTCK